MTAGGYRLVKINSKYLEELSRGRQEEYLSLYQDDLQASRRDQYSSGDSRQDDHRWTSEIKSR